MRPRLYLAPSSTLLLRVPFQPPAQPTSQSPSLRLTRRTTPPSPRPYRLPSLRLPRSLPGATRQASPTERHFLRRSSMRRRQLPERLSTLPPPATFRRRHGYTLGHLHSDRHHQLHDGYQNCSLTVTQATPTITWAPRQILLTERRSPTLSSMPLRQCQARWSTLPLPAPSSLPVPPASRLPSLRLTPPTIRRSRRPCQLTVTQAAPVITWSNPASITYGTALSATQLNATSSVPGTFVYTPAAGSIPAAGTDTLSVTFTPTDTTNYTTVTKTVQLSVTQGTPVITWSNPAGITYGTALSATQLNATASVAGTLVYTPAAGSIPAAGTDTLSVTFTPTDTTNYSTVTKTVQITVTQAAPVITWANPASIHLWNSTLRLAAQRDGLGCRVRSSTPPQQAAFQRLAPTRSPSPSLRPTLPTTRLPRRPCKSPSRRAPRYHLG